MKLSSSSKGYIKFDERGHRKIKPKPFLKPALEMAMKKRYLKKNGGGGKKREVKWVIK